VTGYLCGLGLTAGLRVGLLGGSFNPAHQGHLEISRAALRVLGLDRVVWLVSPHNPLKSADTLADYAARLAAARDVARDPRILVSDFEAEAGLTYTVDVVARLKALAPGVRFVYLMGADNLASLARWHQWTRLMAMIPIAVLARPGYGLAALASPAAQRYRGQRLRVRAAHRLVTTAPPAWVYIPYTHRTESATAIRESGAWPAGSPEG
jgi:nicotinate-nucleotide adenylyltransferase